MWLAWQSNNLPAVRPGRVGILGFYLRSMNPADPHLDDACLRAELLDGCGKHFKCRLWYHIPAHAFYKLDDVGRPDLDPLLVANHEEVARAILRM